MPSNDLDQRAAGMRVETDEVLDCAEVFPDLAALREAAQTLQANAHKLTIESFRSNPRIGGFNVVQLFDSNANEVDGLVDLVGQVPYMAGQLFRPLQNGLVQFYALLMILGVAGFVLAVLLR